MTSLQITKDKMYITRGGQPARIYENLGYAIHGAVFSKKVSEWCICSWNPDGQRFSGTIDQYDLVEPLNDQEKERPVYFEDVMP